MFEVFKEDLKFIRENDPAARNSWEIILTYPGFHALRGYRLSHKLWNGGFKIFARWISFMFRIFTGIEIHPAAKIGARFFIDHGMGVVIGETAEIGDNVVIYQGVTLGAVSFEKGKRHPTIEDHTIIGAGAKILGPITIGSHCRIGANAVVLKSAPSRSIIVGVPGQIILRSKPENGTDGNQMPDAIGLSLASALRRLERVEAHLNLSSEKKAQDMHPPKNGIWQGEDFSI